LADRRHRFPVIDLFAGPGGLSEGFSSYRDADGHEPFNIALSIEMNRAAHRTLELRAFFRLLNQDRGRADYNRYLKGQLTREALFDLHPEIALAARTKMWRFQLGREPEKVDERIRESLADAPGPWILIGGPPCVAYSLAGRAHYRDGRRRWGKQRLYQHYLRAIAKFAPTAFIMENVKGLLSSKNRSESVFEQIVQDLRDPESATANGHVGRSNFNGHSKDGANYPAKGQYRIFSFVRRSLVPEGTDFVIRAEEYGIPQRRHRVILLGVRSDLDVQPGLLHPQTDSVTARDVLGGLPPLRSRLSDGNDSPETWADALMEGLSNGVFDDTDPGTYLRIAAAIERASNRTSIGGPFLTGEFPPKKLSTELFRRDLGGISNHESRSHMKEDLWRYVFVAAYGQEHGRSPVLSVFPKALLPSHQSVVQALRGHGHFSDRFRVQIASKPATTVTSHISKDGHYFIHYDPSQCRSLTVREAARLQTFPDDYFFEGNRTEQYSQVGNAVPPLLARQLAAILHPVLAAALEKSTPKASKQVLTLHV
jgi:DNA (cytosine-5)-methyltransferase 1